MQQTSHCAKCGAEIAAHSVSEGRAFYRCYCGRRWSTAAYYGRKAYRIGSAIVADLLERPSRAVWLAA